MVKPIKAAEGLMMFKLLSVYYLLTFFNFTIFQINCQCTDVSVAFQEVHRLFLRQMYVGIVFQILH